MEHWGWNLEAMKVYFTKNADYIDIFAGINVETKEVVITMLGDEYVRENCKNDGGIIEENKSYKMKSSVKKVTKQVSDKKEEQKEQTLDQMIIVDRMLCLNTTHQKSVLIVDMKEN